MWLRIFVYLCLFLTKSPCLCVQRTQVNLINSTSFELINENLIESNDYDSKPVTRNESSIFLDLICVPVNHIYRSFVFWAWQWILASYDFSILVIRIFYCQKIDATTMSRVFTQNREVDWTISMKGYNDGNKPNHKIHVCHCMRISMPEIGEEDHHGSTSCELWRHDFGLNISVANQALTNILDIANCFTMKLAQWVKFSMATRILFE